MIYIVAGNLKQAYQCATKERLHMDLWVFAKRYDLVISQFKPGDLLWITGTYSWNSTWCLLKEWAIANNIEIINKV
jgi:hypothetical protein